jgi:hypothetical protein
MFVHNWFHSGQKQKLRRLIISSDSKPYSEMRPGVTSTSVLGVKRVFGISVVRGPCHVNHFKIVPGVGTYAHKREGQKKFKTRGPSFTHSEINNQSLICPILPFFCLMKQVLVEQSGD